MSEIESRALEAGDIVQLDPERTENKAFAACLMTVTQVRFWGVQGYVQALGESREAMGGQAYYRAPWGTFVPTNGKAVWTTGSLAHTEGDTDE